VTKTNELHIWITGASGFLGQRLVQHFSDQGHRVLGLSRRKTSHDSSLSIDLASRQALNRLSRLAKEIGTPDVLIHAASRQPGPGELSDFVNSNTKTTLNLIDGLSHSLPQKIIYTSTHSVYPRSKSLPVSESAAATGSLPYGATKRWSEEVLMTVRSAQVTILRLPSLYGVGQNDSFVDGLARLALRNEPIELFSEGQLIRDVLHVSDAVSAISSCVTTSLPQSTIMNIGCGTATRTIEYARALVETLQSKSPIIPVQRSAKHFDFFADISQARRAINFIPTPLHESMRRYAHELRT
jgi:nucleoside-diphosphate-sugar epimerase